MHQADAAVSEVVGRERRNAGRGAGAGERCSQPVTGHVFEHAAIRVPIVARQSSRTHSSRNDGGSRRGSTQVGTACAFAAHLTHLTRVTMREPRNCERKKGPYGIRTRAAAVRGRCPRPLDEWAERRSSLARGGNSRPTLRRGAQRDNALPLEDCRREDRN